MSYAPQSVLWAVTDIEGGAFVDDAPDLVAKANEKISRPLYTAAGPFLAEKQSIDEIGPFYEREFLESRTFATLGSGEQFSLWNRHKI